MKSTLLCITVVAVGLFVSCEKESPEDSYSSKMIITTSMAGEMTIYLGGVGALIIDWGNGSKIETHDFTSEEIGGKLYKHIYTDSRPRNITITGERIISMNCDYNVITNLDVSKNLALQYLSCRGNRLTSLDVSKNFELFELYCGENPFLSALDVSKNTMLINLWCYHCCLTSLDVSNNTILRNLSCRGNQISSLDVSKNFELFVLDCSDNPFSSVLDVSKNTLLTVLSCSRNRQSILDLSNNFALKLLNCYQNRLTSLDLSKNTELESLDCSYNLITNLDVSNNSELRSLIINDNQFTSDALNNLFGSFHNNDLSNKYIEIGNNPGSNDCNPDIAREKGWHVSNINNL